MSSERVLKRYWKGPCDLRDHKVVSSVLREVRSDICEGRVFPALRENEIHLYHDGGRVLRIRPQSAYSHSQYVRGSGTGDVTLERLTKATYEELKTRCSEHNSRNLTSSRHDYRETWIVSRLFERLSVWADSAERNQPKLIDVEVRLRGDESRSAEMVDLLFLDDDALTFVEVKRQYDSRVRSGDSQKAPEVVCQVRSYETALKRHASNILGAYRDVGSIVGRAFELESRGFESPRTVFDRVPILVCRKDRRSGKDTWLRDRLRGCVEGRIDPSYLVVDGGAIDGEAAYGDSPRPKWCSDGKWECIDLKTLFAEIRSVEGSNAR